MIQKSILVALVPVCAIFLFSCRGQVIIGHGEKTSTTVTANSFSALEISVPATVEIIVRPGAQASAQVNGYKNLLDHIKVKTENDHLVINSDLTGSIGLDSHAGTTITITVPSLTSLELSSATDANLHGSIRGDKLAISLSGAGNIKIDSLNVTDFTTEVAGAAKIEIAAGMTQRATYHLSGASKIFAFPLQTKETAAEISGAGRAEVTAMEKLNASISGAGTIHYKGHPEVTKEVSGVGSVKDAN